MNKKRLTNKKKGSHFLGNEAFTLIELLAIIVILAIIAVITIPIILNVIENSKKGAAIDSAYGYKDAISKYYVTELSEDTDFKLSGKYIIQENGSLKSETNETEKIHEIPMSGTIPSGGDISIENNIMTNGCMTIGDYKVTFSDKNVTAERGACVVEKPSPENWFVITEETGTIERLSNYWNELDPDKEDKFNIVIPEKTSSGKEIKHIAANAFASQTLKSVKLNKNLETIGTAAFPGNQLESIEIPDSVTEIGDSAFAFSQIKRVKIGNKITILSNAVFANNEIESIEIPNNITKIEDSAFATNHLKYVKIGDNVKKIGFNAFGTNRLTSIIIPFNVKEIGKDAFIKNPDLEIINVVGHLEKPDEWNDNWNASYYENFVSSHYPVKWDYKGE